MYSQLNLPANLEYVIQRDGLYVRIRLPNSIKAESRGSYRTISVEKIKMPLENGFARSQEKSELQLESACG